MKLILVFLCLFGVTAFAGKPLKYISSSDALMKYGSRFKDKSFIVFAEAREEPIKWFDSIPEKKIEEAIHPVDFVLNARPGEFFVFQLGLWALDKDIEDVQIEFSDLKGIDGKRIKASGMNCFNKGGTDFMGKPFTKKVPVLAGRLQALWMGIDLDSLSKGEYKGSVSVIAGKQKEVVPILLKVSGDIVRNHGYDEGTHLSRLNWLNSKVGIDDEVTKGYPPVELSGNTIKILGRTIEIGENGLPASVISYFGPSNQSLLDKGEPVLSNQLRFIIEKENGGIVSLVPGKIIFTEKTPSKVVWNLHNTSAEFDLELTGRMEFDGFLDFSLKLTSKTSVKVKDIRLEIPMAKEKAEYMMGLGHEGGLRNGNWKWKWDLSKDQDMLWIGSVNGGMRVKLKAENYVRPLINVYYAFGPLNLPPSWGNNGNGGVDVIERDRAVVINAFSGSREMKAGEILNYDFELLITPFRVIDRKVKFGDRYFHGGGTNASSKVEMAKNAGANIINIHHAEDIYPFINYPYLDANVPEIKALVNNAHRENMRLKLYYTTREFTKNLPEFWALNSLNGEVIFPGPGNASRTAINPDGPKEWYIKNLKEKYIPAWFNIIKEGKFEGETDLSVVTTPDSRLNNFYVAGLDWMVRNLGIDGVYIDDSALDHFTLQRARKIIDRYRPEGRMDLHSWNHFNKWAGFTSCLNLYMDLLPYIDLVWIGEGRDYDRAPDHWLIEVSGIPFGLPGQMLEGGGNPWRGMVYGITNRPGWVGNSPSGLWKFWDKYNIESKIMNGYWEADCPVKSSNPGVKASVYRSRNEVIISVANWTDTVQNSSLSVDWATLRLNRQKCDIFIPEIADFQNDIKPVSLNSLMIPAKKGYLILLRTTDATEK